MQDLQGYAVRAYSEFMATLWCNGEWQDSTKSTVSMSDRGLLHGLGLFETLLAVDGQPKHVDRHLARLTKGLNRLLWKLPDFDFETAMRELLVRNRLTQGRARIRLTITGGSGLLHDLTLGEDRMIWMSASAIADDLTDHRISLSLGLSLWRRNADSPLVGLKCASYAENLLALDWARSAGHDEVLFINTAGNLCEAATANIFFIKDESLLTPSLESGCLPGVTRELILEFARKLGMTTHEESLSLDDLKEADGCFLTCATYGLMAVHRIENQNFSVGAVMKQLSKCWNESLQTAHQA